MLNNGSADDSESSFPLGKRQYPYEFFRDRSGSVGDFRKPHGGHRYKCDKCLPVAANASVPKGLHFTQFFGQLNNPLSPPEQDSRMPLTLPLKIPSGSSPGHRAIEIVAAPTLLFTTCPPETSWKSFSWSPADLHPHRCQASTWSSKQGVASRLTSHTQTRTRPCISSLYLSTTCQLMERRT